MGRKPTTGRFSTREELIEKVVFLDRVSGLKASEIAANCGVSPPTVSKILAEASPLTRTKEPAQSRTIGLWCKCYQKALGIQDIPYEGQIIEDHGSRWKLKVGGQEVMVNRGACSTQPYRKRK